jgi:hypothetical protein
MFGGLLSVREEKSYRIKLSENDGNLTALVDIVSERAVAANDLIGD